MNMPQSSEISEDEKLWALLSYLLSPIVPLIIMFGMEDKKDLPFLRYHYRQALIWGIVWIILYAILVGLCLSPLALIATIYIAVKAYQGEYVKIPVLTDFAQKQGWL